MKLWRLGLAALLLVVGVVGAGAWWLQQPLSLSAPRVEISIEPGTAPQEVAKLWVQAGINTSPDLLYAWFRASGQARRIQAGSYEVEPGVTPRSLLDRMVKGEQTLEVVRLIEGWTFRQVRERLAKAPHLKSTIGPLDDAQVAALLGIEGGRVDGWLFPDTYAYSRGVSDMTILKRAKAAMGRQLEAVWAQRQPEVPLRTPQEMLVLASVVEKETGLAADRGLIAGVFTNRLRIGMPLQSDPTVIYGMGAQFDGNLRRADLSTDTPWNTYTRRGLPPTPIALTGLAALRAVAMPQSTRALYFVARGDGSSVFSETLADHNRAVNQYQRGGTP
ncbi:MAG: endolytic transglycosylase MltG [Ideonella sp.]|nr:endolytic transglycosylase MltG [Ideonella sp.]